MKDQERLALHFSRRSCVLSRSEIHYLRFDVSVKNSVSVHVLDRLEELIDVELDSRFW